uniref:Acyltransferase n=1 Tax=Serinus canaria TaxID=9135 RepID=A0A8C9KQW8_SERCA
IQNPPRKLKINPQNEKENPKISPQKDPRNPPNSPKYKGAHAQKPTKLPKKSPKILKTLSKFEIGPSKSKISPPKNARNFKKNFKNTLKIPKNRQKIAKKSPKIEEKSGKKSGIKGNFCVLQLIRTVPLEPGRNYLFGFHPHGVLAAGAFGNFCTEATGFGRLFPGLQPRLLTLPCWFRLPLFRDYALAGGLVSSEPESLEHLLAWPGGGLVAVIALGGPPEALEARPGAEAILGVLEGILGGPWKLGCSCCAGGASSGSPSNTGGVWGEKWGFWDL